MLKNLKNYQNIKIYKNRLWQLKTSIIPIVVGALGLMKKETVKHLEKIPSKQNLAEIQNIVLTSTVDILRKALSI